MHLYCKNFFQLPGIILRTRCSFLCTIIFLFLFMEFYFSSKEKVQSIQKQRVVQRSSMCLNNYQLMAGFVAAAPIPPTSCLVVFLGYFQMSSRHNILFVNISLSYKVTFKNYVYLKGRIQFRLICIFSFTKIVLQLESLKS